MGGVIDPLSRNRLFRITEGPGSLKRRVGSN